MGKLIQKGKDAISNVRLYWNKPQAGQYISYKETLNYSLGGIGRELHGNLMGCFGLAVGNMFLAFAVGIRPSHLVIMSTIMTIIQFIYPFIRAKIIDNTRTQWGRFRPYIATMGFVVTGLGVVLVFLPYESMSYFSKLVSIMLLTAAQSFLLPMYADSLNELRTVMSPNSQERAKLFSISSIIFSIAPSVTGLFLPMIAQGFDGTYANLGYYRYVIAIISVVGVFLSLFAAFGTKERVVIPQKAFTPKVNVVSDVLKIYGNKYFWLKRTSGWIGFTKGFMDSIWLWVFMFKVENLALFGVLSTLLGPASLIAMAVTPFLIKKLGSVRLAVIQNVLHIVFAALMWAGVGSIWILFFVNFVSTFVRNIGIVLDPVMESNLKDYTQYKTGKRLDFTFGAAGQIGVPISIATAFLLPAIYESYGFTGNPDIFYDPGMYTGGFFSILFILSMVGGAVCLIPLLFYNLTDTRHREIVGILKLRAMYSDYVEGTITPGQIKESIEQIRKAQENAVKEMPEIKGTRAAYMKKFIKFDFKGYKEGRKNYLAIKEERESIESAKLLVEEMHKFETPFYIFKVSLAERYAAKTVRELVTADNSFLTEAEAMPETTKEEKKFKRYALRFGKKVIKTAEKIAKNYPGGLDEFDVTPLEAAAAMPIDTKEQKKARKAALKVETAKLKKYTSTVKHYLEVKELLEERHRFTLYDEIESQYDEAVIEVEEIRAREKAEAEQAAAERKADKERRKAELKEKKAARKNKNEKE